MPRQTPRKFNGRSVSKRTEGLFEQRVRDYSTGRKITKSDRAAWNRVIAESCRQDYEDWVTKHVEDIEQADQRGDTKAISASVKTLAGTTRKANHTQPTTDEKGEPINDANGITAMWRSFLTGEFSATKLEQVRAEYEGL